MSNKTAVLIFSFIIIFGLVGYFFSKKPRPNPTPNPQVSIEVLNQTPVSTPTEEVRSETSPIVVYTNSGYSPNSLRIKAGTTVVFKNESSLAMWPASAFHPTHTAYSGSSLTEHCPDTNGTALDACTGIQPGSSWSFTFNKKGSWRYHDHLNPAYVGTIIVE